MHIALYFLYPLLALSAFFFGFIVRDIFFTDVDSEGGEVAKLIGLCIYAANTTAVLIVLLCEGYK